MGLMSWLRLSRDCDRQAEMLSDNALDQAEVSQILQFEAAELTANRDLPSTEKPAALTFDELACHFERYRQDAIRLKNELQEMAEEIRKSSEEREKLSRANHQLIMQQNRDQLKIKGQRMEISRLQRNLELAKAQQNRDASTIASKIRQHDALQQYTSQINDKVQDMQLELELLKCVTPSKVSSEKIEQQLAPQPFVVVLVDGDAYIWARDLFSNGVSRSPGALAAIRLKNEVSRQIADTPSIPPTSKVVTRVYTNAGQANPSKRRKSFKERQVDMLDSFRIQFTETMPLFDFVDVGRGKERADQKIRENFQLLLSNPHCHRVFLAVCTDNGFARMLEEYQYHTGAYEKIVLVAPGYVEWDIARLGFRYVTWPSVFANKEIDLSSKSHKHKQMVVDARAAQVKVEAIVHSEKLKQLAPKEEIAGTIAAIAKKAQVTSAVAGQTSRVGLKMAGTEQTRHARNYDKNFSTTEIEAYNEGID